MDEKRTAVLVLWRLAWILLMPAICVVFLILVASLELMGDESLWRVLMPRWTLGAMFWYRATWPGSVLGEVVADDNHPIKDRLRASELYRSPA